MFARKLNGSNNNHFNYTQSEHFEHIYQIMKTLCRHKYPAYLEKKTEHTQTLKHLFYIDFFVRTTRKVNENMTPGQFV